MELPKNSNFVRRNKRRRYGDSFKELYSFFKVIGKDEYYFSINTSSIDFQHKLYKHIDLNELKKTERLRDAYWENVSKSKEEKYKKIAKINERIHLKSNQLLRATHIKFNILLKSLYHPVRNFKDKKTGYIRNHCKISDEELNIAFGDIDTELARILRASQRIRTTKSKTFKEIRGCINRLRV